MRDRRPFARRVATGEQGYRDRGGHHHVAVALLDAFDNMARHMKVRIGEGLSRSKDGLAGHAGGPQILDPPVPGQVGERRAPSDGPFAECAGRLVLVVPVFARLIPEDLDELGVHPLAAEPHLDQLAVGTPVDEVRKRRAMLPVPLDQLGRSLRPSDHAPESGEHPVVEGGLGPTASPAKRSAAEQRKHRCAEHHRSPGARRPGIDEDRTVPVSRQLGAESGPCLDQETEVLGDPLAVRLGRHRA